MKTTKTKTLAILVLALGLMVCPAKVSEAAPIPMGTGFTYQGRLVEHNIVANGIYDFQFKVFDNPDVNLGDQQGSTIYIKELKVKDGNFTVELDFGSGIFTGGARWLEIGVQPTSSTINFTILSPLQEVKPTPYAIHATHALQADEADTLNGFDSTAFALFAHSHDGVYALIGHAHDGSDITTGIVADGRIDASIARDSEITWGNLAGIPAGFLDGIDNIGGTGDITAVLASTGLTGGGITGDVTLGVKVPLSLSGLSSGPIISGTNTGTGYAVDFRQTGASNTNGGLNVTTAAGQYGALILNQGGYSGDSYGLWADATSTNSGAYGGYFKANTGGKYARGIYIDADNTSATGGDSYGLQVYSDCANGRAYGIYSDVGAGSGSTSPLYGIYSYGSHSGTSGTSHGMWSRVYGSNEGDSYGIYSEGRKYSSDTAGTAYGGYFIGDNDRAGGESYGLYTQATGANGHRYGLYSEVTTSSGSYSNYGVKTQVANNNSTSYGLLADLDPGKGGYGVWIELDTTTASIYEQCGFYSNVRHQGTGGNVYGVESHTYSSDTGSNYAGYFAAHSSPGDTGYLYGIRAYCDNDTSGPKYAGYFHKEGRGNYAGYFYGNVHIDGHLSKSSGSFKIDHPLDPENKYLSHSFVESPDMMNVYNGNAALDENGEACVQLPEYFEALNQDFRYQLTAIGAPGPNLYIAEKISDNRFKIAGGKPGMEVSWQVTGVRHDPYAVAHRVQAEEEKNNEERGYYLNPMAYGLPEEKGIESVRNPRVSETRQVAKGDVSYETD